MYAIITLKDISDFVCSKSLVVVCIDMKNQRSNMLIFSDTWCGFSREMFVISASVDPKNPAEGFDAVLETELMYSG